MPQSTTSVTYYYAYKSLHNTETALLRVQNGILRAVNDGKCVLSEAENYLGITGNILSWFHCYLANHKQSVHLLGASLTPWHLDYGVPQGSVLGPFGFSVYLLPLGKIITAHHSGTKYHFWTDDSQVHIIFEPSEGGAANDNMESLIKDISQ